MQEAKHLRKNYVEILKPRPAHDTFATLSNCWYICCQFCIYWI